MRQAIHRALKRLLLDAFVRYAASPDQVAVRLRHAKHRPCGNQEAALLQAWLERRQVRRFVHFTPLENVPQICRYGLIPREYLQLEVVRLALGPRFTDGHRYDRMPHFSCLSITSPNYRMFYSKRNTRGGQWAVIEFASQLLTRFYFEFALTNATSGCGVKPGLEGAERLFALPELRRQLGLASAEPTDPQAEALCDSIIGPEGISAVYVQQHAAAEWLQRYGIDAQVNETVFMPRRDYAFWKARNIAVMDRVSEISWSEGQSEWPNDQYFRRRPKATYL